MNHYSQTKVLSSIHQIDENSTNNYQSNNTSIVIDPEEEEKDLKKRIIKNVNTSIIWREYQLYEVKNALEHNRKIELREIFNKLIPLPIPASIYGMMILFFGLLIGIIKLENVK